MFNDDRDGEVRGWFEEELVNPLEWEFVHPFINDLQRKKSPCGEFEEKDDVKRSTVCDCQSQ